MSRIQLTDTLMDMFIKMAEGNPGALTALMKIAEESVGIDPQSLFGGIAPILSLDSHGIYGSNIYVLFSDKCGRSTRKVLVLLRAVQLGIMPEQRLIDLATDQKRIYQLSDDEFNDIDNQVCERLDEFQKPNKAA